MNTQKHTSGKWIVVDSGGKVISQTTQDSYCDICTLANRPLAISPEVEANAKLIAAAPELLEALQFVKGVLANAPKGHYDGITLRTIDNAINKATS